MCITWVLERDVFDDNDSQLSDAASMMGQHVISWDESWWNDGNYPALENNYVIFHGTLGNADRIVTELEWQPGAFCNTKAFSCSVWYESAQKWLLHEKYIYCSAVELIQNSDYYLKKIDSPDSFFVRPDSPLKPFSGRVIQRDDLSLKALDHGFYYEDENLPIVVMPVVSVGKEWRFVIAEQKPIAFSAYIASDRSKSKSHCPPNVIEIVTKIAATLAPPDPIYLLDVCESDGKIKLLELNPFSGGDLYACDREAIVTAIERLSKNR